MVLRGIVHHPGRINSDVFQKYLLHMLEQVRLMSLWLNLLLAWSKLPLIFRGRGLFGLPFVTYTALQETLEGWRR